VGPSFSGMVAASLLLGQAGPVQVIGPRQVSGGAYTGGVVNQEVIVMPPGEMPERRPFLSRLQNWFNSKPSAPFERTMPMEPRTSTPYIHPQNTPIVTEARRMPQTAEPPVPAGQPVSVAPTAASRTAPIAASAESVPMLVGKTKLRPGNADKVGRDEKFAWVTGQLEIENGSYVIYYATPETIDPHHGRLVLQPQTDMKSYRSGDLVTVEGQVQTRPGLRGSSARYRVVNIGLVQRP
jgi:hypothetical protein